MRSDDAKLAIRSAVLGWIEARVYPVCDRLLGHWWTGDRWSDLMGRHRVCRICLVHEARPEARWPWAKSHDFYLGDVTSSTAEMVRAFNEHPNSSGKGPTLRLLPTLLREEHDELQEALAWLDRSFMSTSIAMEAKVARELADVVYLAYTTAWSIGIDLDAALAEIHRAAMDKMEANVRREDGKIVKPPGFVPPDMTEAVRGV